MDEQVHGDQNRRWILRNKNHAMFDGRLWFDARRGSGYGDGVRALVEASDLHGRTVVTLPRNRAPRKSARGLWFQHVSSKFLRPDGSQDQLYKLQNFGCLVDVGTDRNASRPARISRT